MPAPRMPFNLNTIVLLPLLRAVPATAAVSVVATLASMTGLDAGLLGLGHPETAADDLVAWMMAFSAVLPVCWVYYVGAHVRQWAAGRWGARREPAAKRTPDSVGSARQGGPDREPV